MFPVVIIVSLISLFAGGMIFIFSKGNPGNKNSKQRTAKLLTYIVLVFGIYTAIFYVPLLIYVLASALIFIAMRELINAAHLGGIHPVWVLMISGPILYFFACFLLETPSQLQLYTFFIVVHFDGFSQVTGENLGKHKLIASISPAKTWEGMIGGSLIAILAGICIFSYTDFGNSFSEIIRLTCIIIISALAGDLIASWFKRRCGLKDYSNLIPGHGGVLDRFDSFFMAGAVIQILQDIYSQ